MAYPDDYKVILYKLSFITDYGADLNETDMEGVETAMRTIGMISSAKELIDGERMVWQYRERDMAYVSMHFPHIIFVFDCFDSNEREPCLWREYYYKGFTHTTEASITFGGFDGSKLKRVERRKDA